MTFPKWLERPRLEQCRLMRRQMRKTRKMETFHRLKLQVRFSTDRPSAALSVADFSCSVCNDDSSVQILTAWIQTWWSPPDLSGTSACPKRPRPTSWGSWGLLPSVGNVTATFTSRGPSARKWVLHQDFIHLFCKSSVQLYFLRSCSLRLYFSNQQGNLSVLISQTVLRKSNSL